MSKTKKSKTTQQKQTKKEEVVLEIRLPDQIQQYTQPIAILLIAVIFGLFLIFNPFSGNSSDEGEMLGVQTHAIGSVIGDKGSFTEYDNEICTEDGKPLVIMYSTTWCPHCQWIGDDFNAWADELNEQGDVVVKRFEVDTFDNPITDEVETEISDVYMDIYNQYNPSGAVPAYVFGCKYTRTGNANESSDDTSAELAEFDQLVKELLN